MFQMCNKVVLSAFQRCLSVSRVFQGRFKGVTFERKKTIHNLPDNRAQAPGGGGTEKVQPKAQVWLFFMKPSLIEKMYIIIVFCKCVQIQHN